MRKLIMAAVLLASSHAVAEIIPSPVASDSRVVQASFVDGEPIVLRAKVGRSLRVIFPPGWTVGDLSPSDEHMIRGIAAVRDNDPDNGARTRGDAPNEGPVEAPQRGGEETAASDSKCSLTLSLSLCIVRDRFLGVLASIPQTEQSFPVLMLYRRKGMPDVELNVDFVLSTVPDQGEEEPEAVPPNPALVRTSDQGEPVRRGEARKAEPPPYYYTVRVNLPQPVGAPRPAMRPVARQRIAAPPPAPVAQPVRNRAYEGFGNLGGGQ